MKRKTKSRPETEGEQGGDGREQGQSIRGIRGGKDMKYICDKNFQA